MPKENLSQDLGWSPIRYPRYQSYDIGEWRIVKENDEPIAVIWTNNNNCAGISWITQSDEVMAIHKKFLLGAEMGMPAWQTYRAVESAHDSALSSEFTGALSGADEAMSAMITDRAESA